MFSGHTTCLVMVAMTFRKYCRAKHLQTKVLFTGFHLEERLLSLVRRAVYAYVALACLVIIGSKLHYTLDVLLAVLVSYWWVSVSCVCMCIIVYVYVCLCVCVVCMFACVSVSNCVCVCLCVLRVCLVCTGASVCAQVRLCVPVSCVPCVCIIFVLCVFARVSVCGVFYF